MPSFTIGATAATFKDRISGSDLGSGDPQPLTLSMLLESTEWAPLFSLVTTKYGIHIPLTGPSVVDVVIGPGPGALICGLGTTTAILTSLKQTQYLSGGRKICTAAFLITGTRL